MDVTERPGSANTKEKYLMDYKKWKSGRHDVELRLSMKAAQRFRHVCKFCTEHKRTCPVCAGVY